MLCAFARRYVPASFSSVHAPFILEGDSLIFRPLGRFVVRVPLPVITPFALFKFLVFVALSVPVSHSFPYFSVVFMLMNSVPVCVPRLDACEESGDGLSL